MRHGSARRILIAFERAELVRDDAERRRLLTFVIVGGGATGVEMAGAIAEIARQTLARDFRRIDPSTARIILLEAGPRILPTLAGEFVRLCHAARSPAWASRCAPGRASPDATERRRRSNTAASIAATHDLGGRRRGLAGRALAQAPSPTARAASWCAPTCRYRAIRRFS